MLQPFSEPRVRDNFRIKICFDTNILNYYLNNTYQGLTDTINLLCNHSTFIDLTTTRYVLFELLEVRKRGYFEKKANMTFPHTAPLSDDNIRIFKVPGEPSEYYYSLLPDIRNDIIKEIENFKNHSNIEIEGEIHKSLWSPTTDICLISKLSREDSLVLTSTLMPDELRIQDYLAVLTNDKNFKKFFHEAPGLNNTFSQHSLPIPEICHIQNLKNLNGTQFNLTDNSTISQVPDFIISYIKTLIVQKNKSLFIGTTDSSFSTTISDIIGIKIIGGNSIPENNYLTVIGNNLDFIMTCPLPITEFRNSSSNKEEFPIDPNITKRVVFKWPAIPDQDPLKHMEDQILKALKSKGNLVFLHPDTF